MPIHQGGIVRDGMIAGLIAVIAVVVKISLRINLVAVSDAPQNSNSPATLVKQP
jgi:hypothetical protein